MRSPSTATSAVIGAPPVPSMTVPPRMTRSWLATSGGGGEGGRVDAVETCDVVAQDRLRLLVAQLGGVLVEQLLGPRRSEEHASELQSLMRISYAVFCLKKKTR